MKISIIIPVYNAEKYIGKAVESALQQDECGEIILVEDGSPDNSLEICKRLALKYNNVFLHQHENMANQGAGCSRNLGVLKSKFPWISFLDADDIYLPGRFKHSKKVLSSDSSIDGVYEPVKSSFIDASASDRYFQHFSSEITMVKRKVAPDMLFESLIAGSNGHIHLDGLLIRKESFLAVGMFPKLRLHQDTVLIYKLSLMCSLERGSGDAPVAQRFIHNQNRILNDNTDFLKTKRLLFEDLLKWVLMYKKDIGNTRIDLVKARYLLLKYRTQKRDKQYFKAIINFVMYKILFEGKLHRVMKQF